VPNLHHPTLALLALLTLMGCSQKTTATPAVDAPTMAAFIAGMQNALSSRLNAANQGTLVGAVTLKLSLDRNSRPIACKAVPSSPQIARLLPADAIVSDFAALARLAERECWLTTYPPVPEGLFEHDQVEVAAPLVLMPRPTWTTSSRPDRP
jgi:hypothetical protein